MKPEPGLDICMAAFDLGTTSVAGYLIAASDNRVLAAEGIENPQMRFGGDVISRAQYALEHGSGEMADCARDAVNTLIRKMCARAGTRPEMIGAVLIAGNTAMHHMFLGLSPKSLVHAPYLPAVKDAQVLKAAEYGLETAPEAPLYMLPVIGGFVGSDTVACMLSGGWTEREKLTLLVDIGTNGELVLGDRRRRAACSTAAGPAFEGARIACGMRGRPGAIDRVWLEEGRLNWHVIGEGRAEGICGSGLVDLAAMLLRCGEMDENGVLQSGDRFEIGDTGVYLTRKDISELQLAKAAIAAGISLLADRMGIALSEIEEVDIAGAFGSCIDPVNACAIGLLPNALLGKIVPVGNAAGEGAKLAMMDRYIWNEAQTLAGTTEFLELASLPGFQDAFVDALAFPDEDA